MLVDELGWSDTRSVAVADELSLSLSAEFRIDLTITRVDESETSNCHLGATTLGDKSRCDVKDEGIVESISHFIVGVVFSIHCHFNGEDVGLSVHGDGHLDLSGAEYRSFHDSSEILRAESNKDLAAVALWALKVLSSDDRLSVLCLDWSILGRDSLDNRSVIVEITVTLLAGDD